MRNSIVLILMCLTFGLSAIAQTEANLNQTSNVKEAGKTAKSDDEPKYEAHLNYSVEQLTKNLGTWRTASLFFQRKTENRQLIWGNYRFSNRNGNKDQEFVAGIYQPLKNKWAITAEAMYSPSHKYVGKYSVMGEVEKGLKNGLVLHFGGRTTKYDAIRANTGYGIVEKYWGNNRGAYTLYVTNLSNAGTAPTHRFQYNRYYGENVSNFGAAFSFGREHENLGPGLGILRSNTWSVSLSAKHWLTKKIGLNLDGTIHRQGDIYYRRGFSFGLRYRF